MSLKRKARKKNCNWQTETAGKNKTRKKNKTKLWHERGRERDGATKDHEVSVFTAFAALCARECKSGRACVCVSVNSPLPLRRNSVPGVVLLPPLVPFFGSHSLFFLSSANLPGAPIETASRPQSTASRAERATSSKEQQKAVSQFSIVHVKVLKRHAIYCTCRCICFTCPRSLRSHALLQVCMCACVSV